METTTSMFMLILASVLVFGVLSFFNQGTDSEDRILELREFQVRSLGEVIVGAYTSSDPSGAEILSCAGTVILWNGTGLEMIEGDSERCPRILCEGIAATPDRMTSVLMVISPEQVRQQPTGQYVQWSYQFDATLVIKVFMSVYSGSLELEEGDP
ncbi:MAG: hypothetical protein ACMUHY_01135 [Thermoplasmatota archaeon]